MVGLGKKNAGVCGAENWDIGKESVRQAVSGQALDSVEIITNCMDGMCVVNVSSKRRSMCVGLAGCRLLQDLEVKHVEVDACGDAQSAAEGAMLGLFHYDQLKSKKKTKVTTQLHGRYTCCH